MSKKKVSKVSMSIRTRNMKSCVIVLEREKREERREERGERREERGERREERGERREERGEERRE